MFSTWDSGRKGLLNEVVCRTLDLPLNLAEKPHSDEFCGVFCDSRARPLGLVEEYAAFKSFKLFSQKNYPIFALINENFTKDFLNEKLIKDWRITVIPIRNLDCSKNLVEYSNFMIREMPFLIPEQYHKAVFFQSDGFFLSNGFEDFVNEKNPLFWGASTKHYAKVYFPDNPEIEKQHENLRIISMNGGFSYRHMPTMRILSKKYGNLLNFEAGRKDFQSAPEDIFWNYSIAMDYPEKYADLDDADRLSQDPLTKFEDINKSFGFHCCKVD